MMIQMVHAVVLLALLQTSCQITDSQLISIDELGEGLGLSEEEKLLLREIGGDKHINTEKLEPLNDTDFELLQAEIQDALGEDKQKESKET